MRGEEHVENAGGKHSTLHSCDRLDEMQAKPLGHPARSVQTSYRPLGLAVINGLAGVPVTIKTATTFRLTGGGLNLRVPQRAQKSTRHRRAREASDYTTFLCEMRTNSEKTVDRCIQTMHVFVCGYCA